jgi:tRNA 2-thiouridine synthesizing protein E
MEAFMSAAIQSQHLSVFDEDGLLIDPEKWNPSLAQDVATQYGITPLSRNHWIIIHAIRSYFSKYGVAPAMGYVCYAQDQNKLCVHDLFGTCLNAWRVSGLPNPGEEAKSYLSGM